MIDEYQKGQYVSQDSKLHKTKVNVETYVKENKKNQVQISKELQNHNKDTFTRVKLAMKTIIQSDY